MKNKTFAVNEPVLAADLNALVQDSQITHLPGGDPALIMSQKGVTDALNEVKAQDPLPRLTSSYYNINYFQRKAYPADNSIIYGFHYLLRLAGVYARSVDFGFIGSNLQTTTLDSEPSYAIKVGDNTADTRFLMFRIFPKQKQLKITRVSYYGDWQPLEVHSVLNLQPDTNKFRVTRAKSDGLYVYRIFANDEEVAVFTDSRSTVGDSVYYELGTVGCRAVISDWFCVGDAFLGDELNAVMEKVNGAIIDVRYDAVQRILTFTKADGTVTAVTLNA